MRQCRALIQCLFDRKLFFGFEEYGQGSDGESEIERFDLGTSLGNLANNPDEFFAHSKQTNELYEHLFDGLVNPVDVLYHWLGQFSGTKSVVTAREPDGNKYGPAIFRCHMPNWGIPTTYRFSTKHRFYITCIGRPTNSIRSSSIRTSTGRCFVASSTGGGVL